MNYQTVLILYFVSIALYNVFSNLKEENEELRYRVFVFKSYKQYRKIYCNCRYTNSSLLATDIERYAQDSLIRCVSKEIEKYILFRKEPSYEKDEMFLTAELIVVERNPNEYGLLRQEDRQFRL